MAFYKAAVERAVRTFLQTLVAVVGVTGAVQGIEDVPWLQVLSAAALAAVLSLATSVAADPFGDDEGPSFGPEVLAPEKKVA